MTGEAGKMTGQPDLGQLLAQFIQRRAAGLAEPAETPGEVVPFQATTIYAVDPRTAFEDALVAAGLLLSKSEASPFEAKSLKQPAEWPTLVRNSEPVVALPFALGNFPQQVRDVAPLLTGAPLSSLRTSTGQPLGFEALAESGQKMLEQSKLPGAIFAAAALRLARQFDAAAELLAKLRKAAPASWNGLLLNEEAALAFQRGDTQTAEQLWAKHPVQDSPVVLFNRGLASLFADKPREAIPLLVRAADALPDTSPWHHLARLYLTIAQTA